MASRSVSQSGFAATMDIIGQDLLQNVVARLPATSFASAACVSRSWNVACDRVLCRPKLSSACSLNPVLQIAVEEVVNKVLSEPIRPHFAIVSVGGYEYYEKNVLNEAQDLITAALGSQVPVITNSPCGIIARDAFSDEFKEIEFVTEAPRDAIMLIVGFLPGLKVTAISLSKQIEEPKMVMIDEFVTDIRGFSTSVSGSNSPAAIIMLCRYGACMRAVIEKMDYAMSPETIIVGDHLSEFRCTNDAKFGISVAVALVFAVDMNKPPGIGETQFHAVLSSGLSPVGPTYKVTSAIEKDDKTWIAANNLNGETILNQVYDELGFRSYYLYIVVTKERKYSIGQENAGCMTCHALYVVCGNNREYLFVHDKDIKTGDTFRFYHEDSAAALSSLAAVSSHLRSFKRSFNTGGDKREVFGGLVFSCGEQYATSEPNIYSSLLLDSFPGVTHGGSFCDIVIGRGVLTPYVKESQEQKAVRCCTHVYGAIYLIMSYNP